MSAVGVPFVDLGLQHAEVAEELDQAVQRVVGGATFVLGEELERFEREFAAYCGTRHCIGVGNGFDALKLALQASGIAAGDEVILPSHTFFATAAAVTAVGATPVLVDVEEETCCIDPAEIEAAITPASKAVMPVHLYGRCADMDAIADISRRHGLKVIEDAAQAHGALHRGRRAGSMGRAGCFSFYPTKNLGALGDGGAVITDEDELAARVRRLRNYGKESKHRHSEVGVNSRLDELQAAVLRVKLKRLDTWNDSRRRWADTYRRLLEGAPVRLVGGWDGAASVHHLFVLRTGSRDHLRRALNARGLGAQVHYPVPVHLQPPYVHGRHRSLKRTEQLAAEVLSLPIYPGLDADQVKLVCQAVREETEGRP